MRKFQTLKGEILLLEFWRLWQAEGYPVYINEA